MTKDLTPKDNFIPEINVLFPETTDQSYLLVSCHRNDYSASLISRAVEDCDAQVLNLNVTSLSADTKSTQAGSLPSLDADPVIDDVIVSLRINHRSPESVVRSLERYGYEVVAAVSASGADNDHMRLRANELLRYLEM